jgi:hypothetical protein
MRMSKKTPFFLFMIPALMISCKDPAGPSGNPGSTESTESNQPTTEQGSQGKHDLSTCITVPTEDASIQHAIESLPTEGGTVFVNAGLYVLPRGIHIDRSNVTLTGESGTILKLADNVNQPVLLVGTDAETPENEIRNIQVNILEIDGNKSGQTSETDPTRSWIRNNGIDVRKAQDLWISDVNVHDARSGGLVVSWNSSDVFVTACAFNGNHFDGIALYASERIQISDFQCRNNGAAGLSLDNDLRDVQFSTGRLESNGDVGIFARFSKSLSFNDIIISKNGSHGCFLSHQETGNGTGVQRMFFAGCMFLDNHGWGFWLASPSSESKSNAITASFFSGNATGAIKDESGALQTSDLILDPPSGVER